MVLDCAENLVGSFIYHERRSKEDETLEDVFGQEGFLNAIATPETKPLLDHLQRQLYKALCLGDEGFKNEVQFLSTGSTMLIAAIASAAGVKFPLAPAVISALLAALLVFISKIGLNTWCAQMSERMPKQEPQC